MTWVHNGRVSDPVINLSRVDTVVPTWEHQRSGEGEYAIHLIKFFFTGHEYQQWCYTSEEERDSDYSDILTALTCN